MLVGALSKQEAADMLRSSYDNGNVRMGPHFRRELANDGLSLQDVEQVLRSGCVYEAPEHDIKHGEWKYRIEGYYENHNWLVIVFCFKAIQNAFLITVFKDVRRGRKGV